jgi:capsular exopolysaccharide synthesis family protein
MDERARAFDIRPVLRLIRDGKWILLAGAVIGALVFGFQTFVLAVPQYRATTVVILDTRSGQLFEMAAVVTGLSGETAEINTEIEVLKGRELLGEVVDQLDLVAHPEFNAALVPDGWTVQAKRALRAVIPGGMAPPRPDGWEREATITALQSRVSVQAVPSSFVFRITATSADPAMAPQIADAVAEAYVAGQIAQKAAAVDAATLALSGRVGELETALAEAEESLAALTRAQESLTPDDLVGLDWDLTQTRAAIATTQGDLAVLPAGEAAVVAAGRRDALLAEEAALMERATAVAESERRIDQAWREVEVTRALYEDFLTRLKETTVQREMIQPDSRILSHAVPPTIHASPRRSRTVTMGMVLGLVAAGALVMLREGLVVTFRSAEEVEEATGLRVIASLPEMPGDTARDVLRSLSERPLSPEAEAVRTLRTALSVEPGGPIPGVIMLTSALPDEGKTTTAAILAQNLAAVGLSVALIETDLRRNTFSGVFGATPGGGLVSVIQGETGVEEAIFTADPWGFDVLEGISGSQSGLPDLLASDRFDDAMSVLRMGYDVVLIDTTPLLTAPDARIVGRHAEAVLFCLRWNGTTRDETRRALRLLDGVGAQPASIVLTRVAERSGRRSV